MPGLRIELSGPEAVQRFRDVAYALLEGEKGELSAELEQRLAAKARDLGVHPLDRDAVLAEVAALPAIQALRRLPEEDLEKLAAQARRGDATALARLRQQAEGGHAVAQNKLGWMYQEGRGVPQDDAEAVAWFRRAAEQGRAAAQYELGWMYAQGRGVPQNDAEAVKWYRRAAKLGHVVAGRDLDWMYQQGRGFPEGDNNKWLWQAAAHLPPTVRSYLYNKVREGGSWHWWMSFLREDWMPLLVCFLFVVFGGSIVLPVFLEYNHPVLALVISVLPWALLFFLMLLDWVAAWRKKRLIPKRRGRPGPK